MTVKTQAMYRDEFVRSFEQRQSYLRDTVTTDYMTKGDSLVWLIASTAEAMKQRGVDGLIPAANEVDTQVTINLREMHHRATQTGFDIFTGQGDVRKLLQLKGMAAANKEIDQTIVDALAAATTSYNGGSAVTLTEGKLADIISELYKNDVDPNEMVTAVWTPKAFARLYTLAKLTSFDYVETKMISQGAWKPFIAFGMRHQMSTRLAGIGTATASNFVFAKTAVGHAISNDQIKTDVGYNGEQDYSYARHTLFHDAKILLQPGVLKVVTDDTAAFT